MSTTGNNPDHERELLRAAQREAEVGPYAPGDAGTPGGPDDPTAASPTAASPEGVRGAAALPVDAFPGYEILREISHGGQGVVLLAIQKATKQKVAIKVPLGGPYASPSARRRFEREVELAAQLKHPNVVSVLHAGETRDGQPFYAMEFIRGTPLTTWVREQRPPLDAFLRLFERICEAVQYAHQRGIIHRDLKPSNILVVDEGSEGPRGPGAEGSNEAAASLLPLTPRTLGPSAPASPQPKVLDFGLAKWLAAPADALASLSAAVVGTLPYMSPEQTRGNPDEIDTRTDIYSLGVLLYEALTGQYPYPVLGEMAEVLRHIAQTPPTPPSRRWSAQRGVAVRSGSRLRRGRTPIDDEIETIVLKCLAKERERRYQSALDVARDIRHYLVGEALEARRDSAWYVLKKTLRRHRAAVASAAAIALLVLGGLALLAAAYRKQNELLVRVNEEKDRAVAAEREQAAAMRSANSLADFLQAMVLSITPRVARGRDVTVLREMLDDAAERLQTELANDPGTRAQVEAILAQAYGSIGEFATGEQHFRNAIETRRGLVGENAEPTLYALSNLGAMWLRQGRPQEAVECIRRTLDYFGAIKGEAHRDTLCLMDNLAVALKDLGELAEAEALARRAVGGLRTTAGEESNDVLIAMNNLANVLKARGKLDEAAEIDRSLLALRRNRLGDDHPDTLSSLNNLGSALFLAGRYAEAEPLIRQCLEGRQRVHGDSAAPTLECMNGLALTLRALGRLDEAERTAQGALEAWRRAGQPTLGWAGSANTLALIRLDRNEASEAEGPARESCELAERLLPEPSPTRAVLRLGYWRCVVRQARYAEAESGLLECHAALRAALGPTHDRTRQAAALIIELYDAWHAADPGQGHDDRAAEWRARLDAWRASTQPAAPADEPAAPASRAAP